MMQKEMNYSQITGYLSKLIQILHEDMEKLKKLNRKPFSLTSNGFDFLMSIEAPIAVISICATTQSGKSSLLNQTILELDNCFWPKLWPDGCTKDITYCKIPKQKTSKGE